VIISESSAGQAKSFANRSRRLRLFHVYNPAIKGNEWQSEAIHEFTEHGLNSVSQMDPILPTHPLNVRPNLFPIWPRDVQAKHIFNGLNYYSCQLCREEVKGGDEPVNTMAILECSNNLHIFHFGCLLEFWDQEGLYNQDCPKCGLTPRLPHVRLGMYQDPEDPVFNTAHPTFVDNPYGWVHRPLNRGESIDLDTYDVPTRFRNGHHPYWRQEHALTAAVANAPVTWERREMTDTLAAEEESGDQAFDRMVRELGHRWRMRNIDRLADDDYVMDDAIESVRFAPSQEAAWLRMMRRRRNRTRRYEIEEAGEGMTRYIPRLQ
jgi:hypothetical protein